jgi:hypothetical protein
MRGLIEKEKFKNLRDNKICTKNINLCKEQHVKSLLYMPDIDYVKIHKFLHGCCLKKLDDTFSDDIDLKNAKRKDLIAWKKEFAKKRLTNKARELRFIPEKVNKETAIIVKEQNSIFKEDITYDIKYANILSLWLDEMREKNNNILPDKVIDDIEVNPKKIDNIQDKTTLKEQVLAEIDALIAKKLWENEGLKEHYFQLSLIIRTYLGKRYHLSLIDKTSYQIQLLLVQSNVHKELVYQIKIVLEQSDLVKFAKSEPTLLEITSSANLAKEIVLKTSPYNEQ